MGKQTTPSEKSEPTSSFDKTKRGGYFNSSGQPTYGRPCNREGIFGSRERKDYPISNPPT